MKVQQLEQELLSVDLKPLKLGKHTIVGQPARFVIINLERMRSAPMSSRKYTLCQKNLTLYLQELKWQQRVFNAACNANFNAKRMRGKVINVLFIMKDEEWHTGTELIAKLKIHRSTLSTIMNRLKRNPEYGDHFVERVFIGNGNGSKYRMLIDPWVLKWMYG